MQNTRKSGTFPKPYRIPHPESHNFEQTCQKILVFSRQNLLGKPESGYLSLLHASLFCKGLLAKANTQFRLLQKSYAVIATGESALYANVMYLS